MYNYWIVMNALSGQWQHGYDIFAEARSKMYGTLKKSREQLSTPVRQVRAVIDIFKGWDVYATLAEMEAGGIAESRWIPWVAGRPATKRRKQYRLTPEGLKGKSLIEKAGGLENFLQE